MDRHTRLPMPSLPTRGHQVNVVVYTSHKLVVAGKQTASFVQNVLEPEVTGEARLGYDACPSSRMV
jgi:ribonuclease HIII